jgi:hypothetical protein
MENIEELERKYKELGEEIKKAKKEKDVDRWVRKHTSMDSFVIDKTKETDEATKMPMVRVKNRDSHNDFSLLDGGNENLLCILDDKLPKQEVGTYRIYLHMEKD